jgi:hypothetical protein
MARANFGYPPVLARKLPIGGATRNGDEAAVPDGGGE